MCNVLRLYGYNSMRFTNLALGHSRKWIEQVTDQRQERNELGEISSGEIGGMSPHNCEPIDLNGTRQNRGMHECFEKSDKRKNIYKDG